MNLENGLTHFRANNGGNNRPDTNPLPQKLSQDLEVEPFDFSSTDLNQALLDIAELPADSNPDGTLKPDKIWARELPQWTLGGNLEVGANLAISMLASQLQDLVEGESKQQVSQKHALLQQIAACQSRLDWETSDRKTEIHDPNTAVAAQREFISQDFQNQLSHLKQNLSPDFLQDLSSEALSEFIQASRKTDSIFGRVDRGFFDFIFLKGPWKQPALREEPRFDRESGAPFIGFVLMATRQNPETGKLELAASLAKETGAVSIRPTHQVSASRLPRFDGIHWTPREAEPEPWLEGVQNLLIKNKGTPGINVYSLNSNPSRMVRADQEGVFAEPAVLTVHLDLDELPQETRDSAQELISEKHHWLSLEQYHNLLLLNGKRGPAPVNEFAAGAVGAILTAKYLKQEGSLQALENSAGSAVKKLSKAQELLQASEINSQEILSIIGQVVISLSLSAESQLEDRNQSPAT